MYMDRDETFDARVETLTAQICDALDRNPGARRIQVAADSDDDYDLFEAVAVRLFDQCGVLAVHALQTTPLVFEIGPRARDVWGPAISRVLDAAEAYGALDEASLLDTHAIYEETANTWRNLLRLQPLSMTSYEESLMVRLAEDMALARGLALAPVDRHRFRVRAPRSDRTEWVADYLDLGEDANDSVTPIEEIDEEFVGDGGDQGALWSWRSVLA
ncbi:hypothetical protein psal_cds_871 [Pandoravirus salinus]|uniref:DUF5878 domain-containing protein n=1 Tax=Pandoravirus salinus TaxID=1349410 RepID=A0A291ATW5_9VIRU|nr:hypothetical protein psal_cds_871 [Pandoravirus salinus]ATE82247.1 hypothetical protein psal_cds_871 [Pandoravirus salinus]